MGKKFEESINECLKEFWEPRLPKLFSSHSPNLERRFAKQNILTLDTVASAGQNGLQDTSMVAVRLARNQLLSKQKARKPAEQLAASSCAICCAVQPAQQVAAHVVQMPRIPNEVSLTSRSSGWLFTTPFIPKEPEALEFRAERAPHGAIVVE